MSDYFSTNLRLLSAERVSIAQICRDIGINQQQFSRYLNGKGGPSAHNLRRICIYFEIEQEDLFKPPIEFRAQRSRQFDKSKLNLRDPFKNAFPGELSKLRGHLGGYLTYCMSPSWPGSILVGSTFLLESERQVYSRTVERGKAPDGSKIERMRFDGRVCYHGNRIFLVEVNNHDDLALSETVLYPPHRLHRNYLRGITLGLAWRPHRTPYSVRTMWSRMPNNLTAKEVFQRCGVFRRSSRMVPEAVRSYLDGKTDMLGADFERGR